MKIKQKIKRAFITFNTMLILLIPSISIPTIGFAAACSGGSGNNVTDNVNNGINTDFGSPDNCGAPVSGSQTLADIAKTVVNIFSLLVGIVAVIMIIYGGFRYITSGGESGAVGNAKNTILYALVGLILVALAQTLVHFVLNAATSGTVTTNS